MTSAIVLQSTSKTTAASKQWREEVLSVHQKANDNKIMTHKHRYTHNTREHSNALHIIPLADRCMTPAVAFQQTLFEVRLLVLPIDRLFSCTQYTHNTGEHVTALHITALAHRCMMPAATCEQAFFERRFLVLPIVQEWLHRRLSLLLFTAASARLDAITMMWLSTK